MTETLGQSECLGAVRTDLHGGSQSNSVHSTSEGSGDEMGSPSSPVRLLSTPSCQ